MHVEHRVYSSLPSPKASKTHFLNVSCAGLSSVSLAKGAQEFAHVDEHPFLTLFAVQCACSLSILIRVLVDYQHFKLQTTRQLFWSTLSKITVHFLQNSPCRIK